MERGPFIWIHAVSVGETRAAEPLIRAVLAACPEYSVVLTHMTPTGRETGQALFGTEPRVRSVYLPYDFRPLVVRFIRHFGPRLGVLMETELWPELLGSCHRAGVPTLLANARLSERSARRYARWPALTRATLGALTAIGAQTEADMRRLRALGGGTAEVTGNIKFDSPPPDAALALARVFRDRIGARPVLLAASTREGEEAPLLDVFLRLAPPATLLLLVPRHPQRFEDVANVAATRGLRIQRRSDEQPVSPQTRVWLGDSMGEMFAYYASADVAMIGGSWLPHGGQNLIEACAVGTPAVIGPHTFNFSLVAEQAVAAGAVARAGSIDEGMQTALSILDSPAQRTRMREAGLHFSAAHRGATQRTMRIISRLLTNDPSKPENASQ